MAKYTLKRIILAFVTLFIILTATFFLLKILPYEKPVGNNAARFAYYQSEVARGYLRSSPVENPSLGTFIDKIDGSGGVVTYYYLKSPAEQYVMWLKNIFTRWEWGTATKISPVGGDAMLIIFSKMKVTILINFFSVIVSVPLGIALGIWAALKKNTLTDHIISTLVMVFISVPSFIVIVLLMYLLCYTPNAPLAMVSQWPKSELAPTSEKVLAYIIPVVSLSFGSICGYTRFTRAELTEVMSSDFLLLARTKGLTKSQTIVRHALKNAMVPILPSILAEVIGLLSGSMILESLYGIPGVGSLYINALGLKDYNVVLADMSLYTSIGLLAGVFLDLSYGFIDPRIRMGAKK